MTNGGKGELLDRLGAQGEERLLLAHVLDRAEQARRRNAPTETDFLSPAEQAKCAALLRLAGIPETGFAADGGYDGAERRILLFLPDWLEREDAEAPIRCLRARYRAEKPMTHRDFLGSLMGIGVLRGKIGDILVGEDSTDVLVHASVADFLLSGWDSAGRTKLRLSEVDRRDLHIPEARFRELRDTVSSLRLDALVSVGFRVARGKAAELIASGKVQVNWVDCAKSDRQLAEGDTVSARGFGKFRLTEVGGLTKKGRVAVTVRQFL